MVELRLERVRLLVLRALARVRGDGSALDDELADVDRALATTPQGRDSLLAERAGLGLDELDFLWLVAAVSGDPMVGPHAVALAGAEARRGASLALYAAIAELPARRIRALATTLGPAHPLRRFGLIEPADDHTVEAMTPFRAARRPLAFLDGDDEVDQTLSAIGGAIPAELSYDAAGDAARRRLAATIGAGADLLAPDDVLDQLADLVGRVRNAYQVLERWRFRNVVARAVAWPRCSPVSRAPARRWRPASSRARSTSISTRSISRRWCPSGSARPRRT